MEDVLRRCGICPNSYGCCFRSAAKAAGRHCIDNAIHTFAGVQLRLECGHLMKARGYSEPTGMAKTTGAYTLPSGRIIHTVGSIAEGAAAESDRRLLADCYSACLDEAAGTGCRSIAFRCISTGVFGFPRGEAAAVAVGTVGRWLRESKSSMTVVFDVFSECDEDLYRRLLA